MRDSRGFFSVRASLRYDMNDILVEQKMVIVSGTPGEGLDLIVRCEKGRSEPRPGVISKLMCD